MNFVVFFSYTLNGKDMLKSMAVVKADSQTEAGEKFRNAIDVKEYKDFYIWWCGELNSVYGNDDVIIP